MKHFGESLTRSLCVLDQTRPHKSRLCSPSQPGHVGVVCRAHSWSPGKHELSLCHNSVGSMEAERSSRKTETPSVIHYLLIWDSCSVFCVLFFIHSTGSTLTVMTPDKHLRTGGHGIHNGVHNSVHYSVHNDVDSHLRCAQW